MFKQDKNFNNDQIAVINVCPVKRKVLKRNLDFATLKDKNTVII